MAFMIRAAASMAAVSPVHEQMKERAKHEQDVRDGPENVSRVLLPEEEQRNGEEQAQAEHPGDAEGLAGPRGFGFRLHFG